MREVVLPDVASDQETVPIGQKSITVQGGYGAVFAIMVQILLRSGGVAAQV